MLQMSKGVRREGALREGSMSPKALRVSFVDAGPGVGPVSSLDLLGGIRQQQVGVL